MGLYLFAGIAVSDFGAALAWYESLLGRPPSSFPHDTDPEGNEIGFGQVPSST